MVNEQQKLILQLDEIKGKIQETDDREKIAHYIQQAIKLTVPVEPIEKNYPNGNKTPDYKGKENTLDILLNEVESIVNNKLFSIESVQLQISASLVRVMLNFGDGLHGIEQIINTNSQTTR